MKSWRFHQPAFRTSEGLSFTDEAMRERRENFISRFRTECFWTQAT